MFNRKKKAQELQQLRTQQEERFSAAIEKASAIADPGEKIAALQAVRSQIDFYLSNEVKKIFKKAGSAEKKISGGGDLLFYTGLGASVILSGPLVWVPAAVGGAGYVGAEIIGSLRSKSIKNKQTRELSGHAESLRNLQALADKVTNETIENDVTAIQKSSFYPKLRNIPGFAAKFSAAAAKQAAAAEEALAGQQEAVRRAAEAEAAAKKANEERRLRQEDYKKFKTVLRKDSRPKS